MLKRLHARPQVSYGVRDAFVSNATRRGFREIAFSAEGYVTWFNGRDPGPVPADDRTVRLVLAAVAKGY